MHEGSEIHDGFENHSSDEDENKSIDLESR